MSILRTLKYSKLSDATKETTDMHAIQLCVSLVCMWFTITIQMSLRPITAFKYDIIYIRT